MVTWVIYDISEDKIRACVAKLCQIAGLYRVQESIFLGELGHNRRDELYKQFADLIDEGTDKVYISPICQDDFEKIMILGEGFDHELIANQKKLLLF